MDKMAILMDKLVLRNLDLDLARGEIKLPADA
jgi:hypothetical protein